MESILEFQVNHQEIIHDLVYNFYGNKIATCSSDQKIKVFAKNLNTFEWNENDSWKAHDSAILKLSWAHPEFGQLLASSSFDRTLKIWEEQPSEQEKSARRWVERAKLGHARGTIQDIAFAPNHLGLKIAACAADGFLRIYEAMDPMNASTWTLTDDFEIISSSVKTNEPDAQFCLSWCPSRAYPPMLVIGCGKEMVAKVFRLDAHNQWLSFETLNGHNGIIRDVAWAPNIGRSYQIIATACSDGFVRIYHLTPIPANPANPTKNLFACEIVGEFSEHQSEVWRVEWNVTGTILSSSGDDGIIRLYKSSFLKEWKIVATMD